MYEYVHDYVLIFLPYFYTYSYTPISSFLTPYAGIIPGGKFPCPCWPGWGLTMLTRSG